ncbi:ATP-grasp domain-containing protein [Methylolobus aquaticus]
MYRDERNEHTVRILLLEYVTGGGLTPTPSIASLIAEGRLMRDALLTDLAEIPGTAVRFMQHASFEDPPLSGEYPIQRVRVAAEQVFEDCWQAELALCDAVWPIAPETDGLLARLCRDAEAAGRVLLTAPADAVTLTASKLRTVTALREAGIPAVPTEAADPSLPPNLPFPIVVKPDDGAGCAGIRILRTEAEWWDWSTSTGTAGWVVQPLVAGEHRSLSALFSAGRAQLLSCNGQHLRMTDGGLELEACTVNLKEIDWDAAQRLAAAVAAAIPKLWGYAGIDFIQTRRGPMVLEVNPRLTTSYVGLRPALGINVASHVIQLSRTGRLPAPTRPDGRSVRIEIPVHHAN